MGSGDLMTGQEIYENFTNAPGPDSLLEAQQHLAMVEAVYTDRENQIKALAASMEEGWTGEAAGAAQRGAGPLAVAHGGAAQEMATAKDLLNAQANSFYDARSSVVPVPPAPEKPSTFRNIITMGGAQSDYEHGLSRTNQASQVNVAAMDGWTSASSYNGTMMPTEYGQIDPRAMNISMVESKTPPPVSPFDGGHRAGQNYDGKGGVADGGRHMAGGGNPGTHHGEPNPGGIKAGDHNSEGRNPGQPPGAGSGDGTTPGGYTPPVSGPGSPGWPGGPGSSGWQAGGGQAGQQSAGYLNSELGGIGSGGIGSGAGGAGSRFAAPGSGNSGSGSAPDRLTGGRGTGAAAPGTTNEPIGRSGTAVGAKGPGGRQGMPGMGMGQKGQGAEEEEHQRKYVVEDDAHFQLTDEDGEKVVDPRTGMPLTPPVIGN